MESSNNSYARLQGAITSTQFWYVIKHGPLAPLFLLWGAGAGLLLLTWHDSILPLAWSIAILVILLIGWTAAHHSSSIRRTVLLRVLSRQLRLNELQGSRFGVEVMSAIDQMIQVLMVTAFRAYLTEDDQTERQAVGNVYDALGFHVESEISGELPSEERKSIAREAKQLVELARRTVTERARHPDSIAAPRRLKEFLTETEAGLARVRETWRLGLEHREREIENKQPSKLDLISEEAPSDLLHRRERLQQGFARIGFEPGRNALEHLDEQYERLLFVLRAGRDGDPIVVAEIPSLAAEAYRQAISALEDVLNLAQGVYPPDRERLQLEADQLETEIANLAAEPGANDRTLIRLDRLRSHRERLASIERQELSIEELLHECERCEVCLDRTRLELASLKGETASLALTAVTATLRSTVERARSVQDELKQLKR